MWENIELVILSFGASIGFGIVFQIRGVKLFYAGLGGALTRIVYLILMAFIPYRIIYAALAAFFAAVYAEVLAVKKKMPATVFLYPAIIPLIPGDLIYYTMGGLVLSNNQLFQENAIECILALIGICVGFVLSSTCAHYVRLYRASKA
jgi:uncharacterized membrane protein YjjB (DUF3815 family)